MNRKVLLIIGLFTYTTCINAHDFVVTQNGQKLYFNITDRARLTAEVTYGGSITEDSQKAVGNVEIPGKVQHEKKVYTIISIGKKAFCNSSEITSISFPSSIVSIEDFAFEGCTGLKNVVFSGNQIKFGQGTFFKCSSIENITFGSDWTQIDLAMFRWSDKIQEISIPAKVTKLYNIKKLKGLKWVTVDANNKQYQSINGIIYSKDGTALLSCPRSYNGAVKVADGTKAVKIGALVDCRYITEIDFPKSLNVISFRELSRMEKLQSLTMRAEIPITTAKKGSKEVLLFQLANLNVKIFVPKSALKAYKAVLANSEGEYMEKSEKAIVPYMVSTDTMPNVKNLVGVKNL